MAKRFTDTDKWKKPFIRNLPTKYKVFWFYIIDECNHAGVWQVDMPVAEIRTGEKLFEWEAIKLFGDKIIVFDDEEKWFIPSFIEFQYGELKQTNRAHESVITILTKYNLLNGNKPLTSPLQGAKDKEKDKELDKVKVKGEGHFLKTKEIFSIPYSEHSEHFKSEHTKQEYDNFQKFLAGMFRDFTVEQLTANFDHCLGIGDWKKVLQGKGFLIIKPALEKAIGSKEGNRDQMAMRIKTFTNGLLDEKVFVK